MASYPIFKSTVKELRILFSPINSSSLGVREFLTKSYSGLKKANPNVKFLIREGDSVIPNIYARYEFGKESVAVVDNAPLAEILKKITDLVK